MIERYSTPEMRKIWSEENKYRKWLDVEIAVCRVLSKKRIIPEWALKELEQKASFDIDRINQIEKITHHDVIAFTTAVAEKTGAASKYFHYGLTSTDIVDTAQALIIKEASKEIEKLMYSLIDTLKEKAFKYKETPIIGRTHGIHAEPMTFGLKFAIWFSEMKRNIMRFRESTENLAIGKISGAVGTFAHLEPSVEEEVCKELKIGYAPISTQTLQRDRHAFYLSTLAIIAGTIEKIALEIRHLQRTEVREVEEPFKKGQKGSSAMPHKRNPVKCEQLCGLARVIRTNTLAAFENQALWHERDISHSSVERIILPDSTTLIHYMLKSINRILSELHVYPDKMLYNLSITKGLIFSGQLLLALTRKGIIREDAYFWVQRNAMMVWDGKGDFKSLIEIDPDISSVLRRDEIDSIFDFSTYFKHVNHIYQRVFSE